MLEFCVDFPPPLPMPRPCAFVFTLLVLVVVRRGINTRVTLAAVRGSWLGEEVMSGESEIVVVLFYWRPAGPSSLY